MMNIKKFVRKPDATLLVLGVLVSIAVVITFWQGGWELTLSGLVQAGELFDTIWLRLLLGFTLGGLVQVLVPEDLIVKWLGPSSGLKGLLIGSYSSIIVSGGPFVTLPVAASIYRAGAGVGPVIAYLTGSSLISLQGLIIWQIPFLGVGIPLVRYVVCLFIPPIVGLAGGAFFRVLSKSSQPSVLVDHNIGNTDQQQYGGKDTSTKSEKIDRGETWT
jgi:uncharacterized membrane protein YraQ (UPF0718 family)